jgi:hypothetical protein
MLRGIGSSACEETAISTAFKALAGVAAAGFLVIVLSTASQHFMSSPQPGIQVQASATFAKNGSQHFM